MKLKCILKLYLTFKPSLVSKFITFQWSYAFLTEGGEEKASTSTGRAPKQVSNVDLQELAEGDEDMVEDLELSDQD